MEKTIRLQRIGENLMPTDAISRSHLVNELHIERITKEGEDVFFPRLVKRGYKLAISNY